MDIEKAREIIAGIREGMMQDDWHEHWFESLNKLDALCNEYEKLQAENQQLRERVKELEMLNWLIVDDLGEIFISDANKARVRKNPKIVCTRDEKLKGIFLRTEEEKP